MVTSSKVSNMTSLPIISYGIPLCMTWSLAPFTVPGLPGLEFICVTVTMWVHGKLDVGRSPTILSQSMAA